ncbi:MAG: DMT family transporter [Coriobacteriales bacterium]|jgi:drug/metabolite transporter (DMT)-like permease|nr:DMT family transporter [Coriobacteriales bacterium]
MSKTLKNALLVFAGGWCYGVMVPLVHVAHSMGYDTLQIMVAQYLVGALALGLAVALFSRRRVPLGQALRLAGVGAVAAGTSFGYYHALALLSSAAALTLLFQFVWMGVLLQAVLERKPPDRMTALSMVLVLGGTVFAAGLLEWNESPLDPLGIFYGLLSAVCYTAFLHLSSRVATDLPTVNRTFFTSTGSLVASLCIAPAFISTAVPSGDFLWFTVPLALIGIVLPVFLIQKGSTEIPGSVTTIMASSELPSGIIMGALFVNDLVTLPEVLGVVVILGGIVLSQLDELRGRRAASP